jgi:hypothetical protein
MNALDFETEDGTRRVWEEAEQRRKSYWIADGRAVGSQTPDYVAK